MDEQNIQDTALPQEVEEASQNLPLRPMVAAPNLTAQSIRFDRTHQAKLLTPPAETAAAEMVQALGLQPPEVLLLMVGGTGEMPKDADSYLAQLLSRGVARALADADSRTLVIDGGLNKGSMAMMGQGVTDRGQKTTLVGIAPAKKVTWPGGPTGGERSELEPHHTHFILTEGSEWGDETEMMVAVATALANPKAVATVLINGNEVTKKQLLHGVRQKWPLIILKGSGGLADELADLAQRRPAFIADPDLAEIVVDGRLYFVQLTGPISAFGRLIEQILGYQDNDNELTTLEIVWQNFALYDKNANRQQKQFNLIQNSILVLGVVATFLALSSTAIRLYAGTATNPAVGVMQQLLYYILLVMPITITALVAIANRFSAGNKWILMRASAESLKKEIYRYRTRVEIYGDRETKKVSREMKLHRKEEILSRKLMQTEVNIAALHAYTGPIPPKYGAAEGDDGLSFLSPERYVTHRLEDQLKYYQGKTVRMERQLQRLQWLIYIFGGFGTLLVAINQEMWIALTTAVATTLSTYMEYRQIENTLIRYNQTAAELTSIRSWWIALSAEEKADPKNIDKLVGQTETTIHSEHAAWVQEMQDTMAELRAEQTEDKADKQAVEDGTGDA
jgi:hypothetical protein